MKTSILFAMCVTLCVLPPTASAAPPARPPNWTLPDDDSKESFLACYFSDGKEVTWQWGLTESKNYYRFNGRWDTTKYTMIQKFFSDAPYENLCKACNRAKAYYKESGVVMAMFAADSNGGANYPIVLGGVEVSPNW